MSAIRRSVDRTNAVPPRQVLQDRDVHDFGAELADLYLAILLAIPIGLCLRWFLP